MYRIIIFSNADTPTYIACSTMSVRPKYMSLRDFLNMNVKHTQEDRSYGVVERRGAHYWRTASIGHGEMTGPLNGEVV